MVYLVKHPVHVWEKKLTATEYNYNSRFNNSYGYLDIGKSVNGKANRLDYYLLLRSNTEILRIPLAIHYLYDTLMLRGQFRPVARQSKEADQLWLNPMARALSREREFNQLMPDELHEVFYNAVGCLGDIIDTAPERQQRIARSHFDSLAMVEWKVDMYYKTFKAVNFIENSKS